MHVQKTHITSLILTNHYQSSDGKSSYVQTKLLLWDSDITQQERSSWHFSLWGFTCHCLCCLSQLLTEHKRRCWIYAEDVSCKNIQENIYRNYSQCLLGWRYIYTICTYIIYTSWYYLNKPICSIDACNYYKVTNLW